MNENPVTLEDFNAWLKAFMELPVEQVMVRGLDGREYLTDANKVVPISPARLAEAMADPNLRGMIVTVIPTSPSKP